MSKVAIIREDWPSVPGHGEQHKVYKVKVLEEYDEIIIGKKHWWSRKEVFVKNGMFLKVIEIKEQSDA